MAASSAPNTIAPLAAPEAVAPEATVSASSAPEESVLTSATSAETASASAVPDEKPGASSASAPGQGSAFSVLPPQLPTQKGPLGIRYDFNDGARLLLPPGQWTAQIVDADSGNILFACDSDGGLVSSTKKYFVRFAFKVWKRGEDKPCFEHTLNLKDKPVLVSFPVGTLGDLIGWFPYAERFQKEHRCRLECSMGPLIVELFKDQYPDILFSTPEAVKTKNPYATYRIGLYFGGNRDYQPFDFRQVGLHRTAGYILGVDPTEIVPRLKRGSQRQIPEPYVCIATQASAQAKYWNNGYGWKQVVAHLKAKGYRVLCIDRESTYGSGYVWNHIPYGAEDFTGNRPLQERIALLEHAEFFVGLSSGLSWLAWGCGIPIVLISGFTLPNCEFYTPYRVINTHGCFGCWDDVNENFDHHDFFWCPKYKGTDRQFECTKLITGQQVIGQIERLRKALEKQKQVENANKTEAVKDANKRERNGQNKERERKAG